MFKIPEKLTKAIKKHFPDEKALHIELDNNPEQCEEMLRTVASKRFLPYEICEAFDKGTQNLLFLKAKSAQDGWELYKKYSYSLSKYKEKHFV